MALFSLTGDLGDLRITEESKMTRDKMSRKAATRRYYMEQKIIPNIQPEQPSKQIYKSDRREL